MLVDWYLRILHLDRRLPLNFDLGPLHVHLHARSVFFMWVTVVILVIAGIAVLASQLLVVVDAAVPGNRQAQFGVDHRLGAGFGQVDDSEATMTKCDSAL